MQGALQRGKDVVEYSAFFIIRGDGYGQVVRKL